MGDVLGEGSYAKVKEAIDSEALVRQQSASLLNRHDELCAGPASRQDHEEKEVTENTKRRGQCGEGDKAAEGT